MSWQRRKNAWATRGAQGALLVALGCLLAPGGPFAESRALAQSEITADIYVIRAADAPGTIDARLSGMPQLRLPPFDGYGTMAVLNLHSATLAIGTPHDETLPNGRVLRIVIESVTEEGRYRVRVAINRPGETDYLPLLTVLAAPGDPFFVAGQRYLEGMLIIAIQLGTSPAGGARGSSADDTVEEPVEPREGATLAPLESPCHPGCAIFRG